MDLYTRAATVVQYSKEMYDLMDFFEKNIGKVTYVPGDFKREEKSLWKNRNYYCNGRVNDAFRIFMQGYIHCKSVNNDGKFD